MATDRNEPIGEEDWWTLAHSFLPNWVRWIMTIGALVAGAETWVEHFGTPAIREAWEKYTYASLNRPLWILCVLLLVALVSVVVGGVREVRRRDRVWQHSLGGWVIPALEDLRQITISFGPSYKADGRRVLAQWGEFLLKAQSADSWARHMSYDVSRDLLRRVTSGEIGLVAHSEKDWADTAKQVSNLWNRMSILGFFQPVRLGTDRVAMLVGHRLSDEGTEAMVIAQRIVGPSEIPIKGAPDA